MELKQNEGTTALHVASDNKCIEVLNLLLNHGANFAALSNDLLTPLHAASASSEVALVKALLDFEEGQKKSKVASSSISQLDCLDSRGCGHVFIGHARMIILIVLYT